MMRCYFSGGRGEWMTMEGNGVAMRRPEGMAPVSCVHFLSSESCSTPDRVEQCQRSQFPGMIDIRGIKRKIPLMDFYQCIFMRKQVGMRTSTSNIHDN
jgi:hypothetical protein